MGEEWGSEDYEHLTFDVGELHNQHGPAKTFVCQDLKMRQTQPVEELMVNGANYEPYPLAMYFLHGKNITSAEHRLATVTMV